MKTRVISIVTIVVLVGALFIIANMRKPKPAPPTTKDIWAEAGVPVEVAKVTRGDMEQTVEVTGDINALQSVTLSAKIPGRIASVLVREGDAVSVGQTVAVLDQDDALSNVQTAQGGLESALARLSQAGTNSKVTKIETNAAIEQAQANLKAATSRLQVAKTPQRSQERMVAENRVDSAKANLDNAHANYKRHESLLKEGAIAPSQFDVVKAQYLVAAADYKSAKDQLAMIQEGGRSEDIATAQSQVDVAREQLRTAQANASQNMLRIEDIKSAQAGVRQARAAVALAKQQLANTYIKSSIAGEVSSRSAEPGQVVSIGQPIIGVVNLNSIYFKGDISETNFGSVSPGQRVRVQIDAFPNVPFQGSVAELYPSGSATSRNFTARISIAKGSSHIKPGMFARGMIVIGTAHNTLLIPKDAIDERKGTQSVFTLSTDKTVKRHIVEVIRENQNYVEIRMPTDVKVGDTVITQGRQNLQEGTKVQITGRQ